MQKEEESCDERRYIYGRGDDTNKIEIYIPKIISSDDETEERTERTMKIKIVVVE